MIMEVHMATTDGKKGAFRRYRRTFLAVTFWWQIAKKKNTGPNPSFSGIHKVMKFIENFYA